MGSEEPNHEPVDRGSTGDPHACVTEFMQRLHEGIETGRKRRLSDSYEPELAAALNTPSKRRLKAPTPQSPPILAADPRLPLWHPPASPYGLIEEELYSDPWRLLVACLLLNKTTSAAVRRIIWSLFEMCPSPQIMAATHMGRIQALIAPLGLSAKRAVALQRLSHQYVHCDWHDPRQLFGVGKYAADAYHMFCRGQWRQVEPEDKDLKRYRDWLAGTDGLGLGFERARLVESRGSGLV